MTVALLATSFAQANQLDNLINASQDIVNQIDTGIKLVGAATEYSQYGQGMSDGSLAETAHITSAQIEAYNTALMDIQEYQPYGSVTDVLEAKAAEELSLMNDAVNVFTTATVEIIQVAEINNLAGEANTPQEQEEVQSFVESNQEMLMVSHESVQDFNESLTDIETHANSAVAYMSVAASPEAVAFFEQGVESANTTAEQTSILYDANRQWVQMGYNTTRNLSAVMLNGTDGIGLNVYATEAEILIAGSQSEFYLTSPLGGGFDCYMTGGCE